jgi:plastocyanin
MRRVASVVAVAAAVLAAVAACRDAGPTAGADARASFATDASPASVVVEFGREHVGSSFPPPSGHDRSFHAKDKMNPRTVVIERGGTVTFTIAPLHRPAVYERGTEPGDIEVSPATLEPLSLGPVFIPNFVINDPDGRIAQAPSYSLGFQSWTTPPFTEPGRYLVICTTRPHFVDANMYGWVIVK